MAGDLHVGPAAGNTARSAAVRRAWEAHRRGVQAGASGRPVAGARHLRAGLLLVGWEEGRQRPAVEGEYRPVAARLLISLAHLQAEQGRTEHGLRLLGLAKEMTAPADLGILLSQRGLLLMRTWRIAEALRFFDAAVPLLDGHADVRVLARLLLNRGFLHLNVGSVHRARADFAWCQRIAAAGQHDSLAAKATHNLGCCDVLAGDIPAALKVFAAAEHGFRLTASATPQWMAVRIGGTAPDQALRGRPAVRVPATGRGVRPAYGSIGSPWTGSTNLPPVTTTGRVFFTTRNGENWSCSGSTVNSAGKDSVITAGHCVYGSLGGQVSGEGWHTNWIFVPGYENGYAPYGIWTAKELWTPTNYYDNQDEGDDICGAVINTNAYGQHIVNVLGGQGIAWNYANDQFVYDFGYPAEAPFNGATLQYCTGSEFNWSGIANTMGLPCSFTGGSSGGPWLMSFNGEFGYVNGVNDFDYSSLPGYIFAAYFGNNAASLYDAMANL